MSDFGQKYKNFIIMERCCKWVKEIVSSFNYPQEKKGELALILQRLLRKHQLISSGMQLEKKRLTALDNLEEISSLLSEEDIELLSSDPEEFYKKFIFCEGRKFTSLYFLLKKKKNKQQMENIFIYAQEEYNISPYEKIDRNIVESMLPEFEMVWV